MEVPSVFSYADTKPDIAFDGNCALDAGRRRDSGVGNGAL